MADWDLVSDGMLTIDWIFKCEDIKNARKTLVQIWMDEFAPNYPDENKKPLNKGFLIMASYLLFVYIKESEIAIDYDKINIEKFKTIEPENNNIKSMELCRRIRNSISHSNFHFENDNLIMEDSGSKKVNYFANILNSLFNRKIFKGKKENYIKFSINIVDFGLFIHAFAYEVNRQKIAEQNK